MTAAPPETVVSVSRLDKRFETASGPLEILRDLSLELGQGENLAVVGPSGSGKSTLLHIVGTLDQPTSGKIRLLGKDVAALNEPGLADFRNRHIGFVFQEHHLMPQLSVLENVLVPCVPHGVSPAAVERARHLVDQVGLADRLDHRPGQLSGGERQRVAVARALVNEPAILLADEPTGSLDRQTAESVSQVLLELHQAGQQTLICVTHNDDLAERFQRQTRLDSGTLVETG